MVQFILVKFHFFLVNPSSLIDGFKSSQQITYIISVGVTQLWGLYGQSRDIADTCYWWNSRREFHKEFGKDVHSQQ